MCSWWNEENFFCNFCLCFFAPLWLTKTEVSTEFCKLLHNELLYQWTWDKLIPFAFLLFCLQNMSVPANPMLLFLSLHADVITLCWGVLSPAYAYHYNLSLALQQSFQWGTDDGFTPSPQTRLTGIIGGWLFIQSHKCWKLGTTNVKPVIQVTVWAISIL